MKKDQKYSGLQKQKRGFKNYSGLIICVGLLKPDIGFQWVFRADSPSDNGG
jgi:hypothetical protein